MSTPSGGTGSDEPSGGGVAGVAQTSEPGGLNLLIPLLLLVLLVAAILLVRMLRREAMPVPVAAMGDDEPERPVWVPWWRSTMTGPTWNDAPPPSREASWAESPAKAPEPEPEPPEHEPWTAPRTGRPVR